MGTSTRPLSPSSSSARDEAGQRIRVLFLCTHNSARSQMAEGFLRVLGGEGIEVDSAGTDPSRVHPLAVEAMASRGIDIGSQRSKHMNELLGQRFDYVITVCDSAAESCPVFPGAPRRIHWSIPDPTSAPGDAEAQQRAFDSAAKELSTRIGLFLPQLRRSAR